MVRLSRKALSDLYEAPLPELQAASSFVRQSLNGDRIWYNRNFHIEPSNICAHRCRFCSYRRDDASQPGAWSMALDDILPYCEAKFEPGMTEIHIVGSVHPGQSFDYTGYSQNGFYQIVYYGQTGWVSSQWTYKN